MRSTAWTQAEEEWLRSAYPTHSNQELADMHADMFPDRPRRTAKSINSRAKVYKLHKSYGFDKFADRRFWTPDKVEWFCSFVPGHSVHEISAEHARVYGEPLTDTQVKNAKVRFGVKSGTVGGRFEKGSVPFNKGRKWDEFMSEASQERSRATCFKKGQVSGIARERLKPVGYERVDPDGYVWVKVKDTPQETLNDNFRPKHHVVYEQAHGEIPSGCIVVFADRDRRNFDPDNLVAVPRSLWSVISHRGLAYHDAESLNACMAVASLDKAVYAARCRPRKCKRCGAEFKPRFARQRTCDGCLGWEG